MNVQLKDITVTARDGRVSHLDQVYIRGSHVRFFIVPDMLRCVQITRYSGYNSANMCPTGTHQCSEAEALKAEVSVWREDEQRLAGRERVEEEVLLGVEQHEQAKWIWMHSRTGHGVPGKKYQMMPRDWLNEAPHPDAAWLSNLIDRGLLNSKQTYSEVLQLLWSRLCERNLVCTLYALVT